MDFSPACPCVTAIPNPRPNTPGIRLRAGIAVSHPVSFLRDKKTIVGQYSDDGLFYEKACALTHNFQAQHTSLSPDAYSPDPGVLLSPIRRLTDDVSFENPMLIKKHSPSGVTGCALSVLRGDTWTPNIWTMMTQGVIPSTRTFTLVYAIPASAAVSVEGLTAASPISKRLSALTV